MRVPTSLLRLWSKSMEYNLWAFRRCPASRVCDLSIVITADGRHFATLAVVSSRRRLQYIPRHPHTFDRLPNRGLLLNTTDVVYALNCQDRIHAAAQASLLDVLTNEQ